MASDLAQGILDLVARELSLYDFRERYDKVGPDIAGVVKTPWKPLCRLFGGHGIVAVVTVPASVTGPESLRALVRDVRLELNSSFVGVGAYKSTYSFLVLLCPQNLLAASPGVASSLKDRTGLHRNIIQGVILVDLETREVTGDYSWPARHWRIYELVTRATMRAVQ